MEVNSRDVYLQLSDLNRHVRQISFLPMMRRGDIPYANLLRDLGLVVRGENVAILVWISGSEVGWFVVRGCVIRVEEFKTRKAAF